MKLTQDLIVAAIGGALDVIKRFVDEKDFIAIADKVFNAIEGKFKEDGMVDTVLEMITGRLRKRFNVPDSNPDN